MWIRPALVSSAGCGLLILLAATQSGCGRGNDGFSRARQLIVDGKFAEGDAAMRAVIDEAPRSKHASRAGLFLFKTSVAMGKLDEAQKWCQWTIDNHPTSPEAHKCRYKLGMLKLMAGKPGAARERFELLAKAPDGPLAAESKAMVGFLKAYRIEPVGEPQAE